MKKIFFSLTLISILLIGSNYKVLAYEDTSAEVNNSTIEITPSLWTEGSYLLDTNSYQEIAWEVNNWLTANVNVTNGDGNPGNILFYVIDNAGKVYSTTEVAPGETKTLRGIPSGGYSVYAKAKSVSGYYILIIDDWVI